MQSHPFKLPICRNHCCTACTSILSPYLGAQIPFYTRMFSPASIISPVMQKTRCHHQSRRPRVSRTVCFLAHKVLRSTHKLGALSQTPISTRVSKRLILNRDNQGTCYLRVASSSAVAQYASVAMPKSRYVTARTWEMLIDTVQEKIRGKDLLRLVSCPCAVRILPMKRMNIKT